MLIVNNKKNLRALICLASCMVLSENITVKYIQIQTRTKIIKNNKLKEIKKNALIKELLLKLFSLINDS